MVWKGKEPIVCFPWIMPKFFFYMIMNLGILMSYHSVHVSLHQVQLLMQIKIQGDLFSRWNLKKKKRLFRLGLRFSDSRTRKFPLLQSELYIGKHYKLHFVWLFVCLFGWLFLQCISYVMFKIKWVYILFFISLEQNDKFMGTPELGYALVERQADM